MYTPKNRFKVNEANSDISSETLRTVKSIVQTFKTTK